MLLLDSIITTALRWRISKIETFLANPEETQKRVLFELLEKAKSTQWGKTHKYSEIKSIEEYKNRVPVSIYEDIAEDIERIIKGEQNIFWPTEIKMFSRSSGTTNARHKIIPVSVEALEDCHFKGGKDMLTMYVHNNENTRLFAGKTITIGGSLMENPHSSDSYFGDVSAVIMKNLPFWIRLARTPNIDTALLKDWEEKLEKMATEIIQEYVTCISGVPTWSVLLLQRVLEITKKDNLLEVWPDMEVFVHGAVSFAPYQDLFKKLVPKNDFYFVDNYNASEGFFAAQDRLVADDMLLLLDHGVFFEFITLDQIGEKHPKSIWLDQVSIGVNYAMLISTNAGLWRYMIGDTIKFTSTKPHRIKVTGRTKHFINAFGEELIIENADQAIAKASKETEAIISNYTAAPIYISANSQGSHQWLIEFEKEPNNLDIFINILDQTLRENNADYDAKRANDMALLKPSINLLKSGSFYLWLKKNNRLGAQNKIPRLSNDRAFVEEMLRLQVEV